MRVMTAARQPVRLAPEPGGGAACSPRSSRARGAWFPTSTA